MAAVKSFLSTNKLFCSTNSVIRKFSVNLQFNMRLVQFVYKDSPCNLHIGLLKDDEVVDINAIDNSLPCTMLEVLRKGYLDKVKSCSTRCVCNGVPLSSVELAAPIHGMDKVLCIGLNYRDHCEQHKLTPPEVPMVFSKFSSTVIGPKDALELRTRVTDKVDWEVELVAVMGKRASNVKASEALSYIAGYTVGQDISARDWQKTKNGGQFLLGKSMDTFCPIGPCITTSDEIGDPQNLAIKCTINGVLKQTSRTDQLIHKIPDVIERLSSVMTLLPGDIILTGTPGGVGMYRDPPEYLRPGDVIHSEVQNIGVLETKCVEFTKTI